MILSDEDSPIEGGIEIEARLPGKREQGLVLLSGGERSLTAVALIFALLKVSPTPHSAFWTRLMPCWMNRMWGGLLNF